MRSNLEGAIDGRDPDALHDLRVAVRRSRSLQRQLRGAFPAAELRRVRAELKLVQGVTGEPRDLDVLLDELGEPAGGGALEPLRAVLRERREEARDAMVRALRSERCGQLLESWAALLATLSALPEEDRPDAARPIGEVTAARIAHVHGQMARLSRRLDEASPPERYHELRKKGKELRYLLELLGAALYPRDAVRPPIRALKELQDVLGRHQDREVQAAAIRSMADAVGARPGGAAALIATGELLARLRADEQAAREEFRARFTTLGRPEFLNTLPRRS
jgi:CHAD domain-containing protein